MCVACPLRLCGRLVNVLPLNNNGHEYMLSRSVCYVNPVRCDRAFTASVNRALAALIQRRTLVMPSVQLVGGLMGVSLTLNRSDAVCQTQSVRLN